MTTMPTLPDPIADEREDRDGTEALLGAFAALRPDREAFAKGVRERIQAPRANARTLSPFLRAAAAVLPTALLPKGLVAAAPAVAAKTSVKWLPCAVLMPIATVAAFALTVLTLVRGLLVRGRDGAANGDAAAARTEVVAWWSQHRLGATLAGVLLLVGIPFVPGPVLTILFLGVAVVLLLLWSRLARAGLASRAEVGAMAGRTLEFLAIGSASVMPWAAAAEQMQWQPVPSPGQELAFAMPPLLALGAFACQALARHGKRYVARGLWLTGLTSALAWLAFLGGDRRMDPPTTAHGWHEAFDEELAPLGFSAIGTMVQNLRAAGLEEPDEAELRTFLDAIDPTAFDFAGHTALDLGLVDDARGRSWLAALGGEKVGDDRLSYPILVRSPSELLRFRLLARTGSLPGPDARRLATAVVHAFEEPAPDHSGLSLCAAAATLQELGADPEVLRVRAHELLVALRSDANEVHGLGFSRLRRPSGEPLDADSCRATSTADAVRLLLRFGAPSDLDLAAVDRHLQRQAAPRLDTQPFQKFAAFAALAALRTAPGHVAAEPGLLDILQRWQLFFAGVVLVAFGLAATLRSRPNA